MDDADEGYVTQEITITHVVTEAGDNVYVNWSTPAADGQTPTLEVLGLLEYAKVAFLEHVNQDDDADDA